MKLYLFFALAFLSCNNVQAGVNDAKNTATSTTNDKRTYADVAKTLGCYPEGSTVPLKDAKAGAKAKENRSVNISGMVNLATLFGKTK